MSEVLAAAAEAVAAATAAAVAAAGVRGAAISPCKGMDDARPGAGPLSKHCGDGSNGGGGSGDGGNHDNGSNGDGGDGSGVPSSLPFAFSTPPRVSQRGDSPRVCSKPQPHPQFSLSNPTLSSSLRNMVGARGPSPDLLPGPRHTTDSVPARLRAMGRQSGLYYLSPESLRPPVTSVSAARARQERSSRSELGARSGRGARSERGGRGEREVHSERGARSARGVRAAWSFPTTAHQLHIAEPSAVWGHPSEQAHHTGHAFARSPRSCNDPIPSRAATRVSTRAVACAANRATSPPRSTGHGRANASRRSGRAPSPRPAAQLHRIQTGCFSSSVAARAASDRATSPPISPAQLYSSRAAVHLGLTQPGFFAEGWLTTRPVSSPSSYCDARPVAFGSRRPQRPAHVALMSSAAGDATALRSAGSAPSVRGVF